MLIQIRVKFFLTRQNPPDIPAEFGKPKQTENIEVGVNLPANGDLKDPAAFNFKDADTYNRATSSTVYNSADSVLQVNDLLPQRSRLNQTLGRRTTPCQMRTVKSRSTSLAVM